jgi:hypothetical protein
VAAVLAAIIDHPGFLAGAFDRLSGRQLAFRATLNRIHAIPNSTPVSEEIQLPRTLMG